MRILVVEDQALVALTLADVLRACGHHVIGPAHSSQEALELAASEAPAMAFVDIDLEATGIGLEIARRLHCDYGVAVVFTTGRPHVARTSSVALGLLSKPYSARQAADTVPVIDTILRHPELAPTETDIGLELFPQNFARVRARALIHRPILLAEDHPNDVELTLAAFERSGSRREVIVARDGVDAIDHLEACSENGVLPSLILLDLKMPKLDGFGVLARVKESLAWRAIPVVLLSASREERDISRAYSLGANAFVSKPHDFSAFSSTLERLVRFWGERNQALGAGARL